MSGMPSRPSSAVTTGAPRTSMKVVQISGSSPTVSRSGDMESLRESARSTSTCTTARRCRASSLKIAVSRRALYVLSAGSLVVLPHGAPQRSWRKRGSPTAASTQACSHPSCVRLIWSATPIANTVIGGVPTAALVVNCGMVSMFSCCTSVFSSSCVSD